MAKLIAVTELERLQNASAWSPLNKVIRRQRSNQHVTRYTFEDTSILAIYSNGDASWFHRDERGQTSGEQRWPGWHRCYSQGK